MVPSHVPFYMDWKFWSAVIALLALALSQLPPLYKLFRPGRLHVDGYQQIAVTHKIGNPNLGLYLSIGNVGGRILKVRRLTFHVRRENGPEFVLNGTGYFPTREASQTAVLAPFRINPGDEWGHVVQFVAPLAREEERDLRGHQEALRLNIVGKRAGLVDKSQDVPADDAVVQPLLTFFNGKFKWQPGEYSAVLEIITEPKRASTSKSFRFTLFESDNGVLLRMRDEFKFGFWVLFDPAQTPWRQAGVVVALTEA